MILINLGQALGFVNIFQIILKKNAKKEFVIDGKSRTSSQCADLNGILLPLNCRVKIVCKYANKDHLELKIGQYRSRAERKKDMKIWSPPLVVLLFVISAMISAGDRMNHTQSIIDGDTLVSKGKIFVLGFFHGGSGSSTENRYLGIWYAFSTETVVWVANRENPLSDTSGVVRLTESGDLVILPNRNTSAAAVWSTNSSNSPALVNPVAQLLDSGNLIITDDKGVLLWQSFDHPSDTLLPGMKLGFDKTTGQQWFMTSWKTPSDPSPGSFVCKMNMNGSEHEIFGDVYGNKRFRIGPWNGHWFSGLPRMKTYSDYYNFTYVDNQTTTYYRYDTITPGMYGRLMVFPNNTLARVAWNVKTPRWVPLRSTADECDQYSRCGPNGVCNPQGQKFCQCYQGFHPNSNSSWTDRDYSGGCRRNEKLDCASGGTGYIPYSNIKLPDTTKNATIHRNISLESCRLLCSANCSCSAYAPYYLSDIIPRGCVLWFSDLLDTKVFDQDGQDLYLRLPPSEIPTMTTGKKHGMEVLAIAIIVPAFVVFLVFGIVIWVRKKAVERKAAAGREQNDYEGSRWNDELPLFDLAIVSSATSNFADANVIGRGGFGTVYKVGNLQVQGLGIKNRIHNLMQICQGDILNGVLIAVKRLNSKPTRKRNGQGVDEFMNEVSLIAKLQHRNLVRLLGCCIQQEERILIYEFMKNRSLDGFIFGGSETRAVLDWKKRVEIIIGIARGLLYLHQDSRLNVIHRDLKAGNVLLDEQMNPKISDFGTARIFEGEQSEVNTERVIGTYGYMSPEYAMDGVFSTKSDVFSFGVLLLEIISGKKNRTVYQGDDGQHINLPSLAWKLREDGSTEQFVDKTIKSTCSDYNEVERFIQIGLLCVQEFAIDRPAIKEVIIMLSSETSSLPKPLRPGFSSLRTAVIPDDNSQRQHTGTTTRTDVSSALNCTNEITMTNVDFR